MRHLVKSFQEHVGSRGVHFYDKEGCNFLPWSEVFYFLKELPNYGTIDTFSEKLAESLANYNPDCEFLAVQQDGDTVSVELYAQAQ